MAKYPYIVVKDGVWYPAGAEVPAKKPAAETSKEDVTNEMEKEKDADQVKKK